MEDRMKTISLFQKLDEAVKKDDLFFLLYNYFQDYEWYRIFENACLFKSEKVLDYCLQHRFYKPCFHAIKSVIALHHPTPYILKLIHHGREQLTKTDLFLYLQSCIINNHFFLFRTLCNMHLKLFLNFDFLLIYELFECAENYRRWENLKYLIHTFPLFKYTPSKEFLKYTLFLAKVQQKACRKIYFWWIPICYDPHRQCGKNMAEKSWQKYEDMILKKNEIV